MGVNTEHPKVLKVKCIIAALFEFIFPFMTAIKAATQVPTFDPKVMNKALWILIAWFDIITITKPVTAAEDWIKAVNNNPNNSSKRGKSIVAKRVLNPDLIDSSLHDELINLRPTNIIPRPFKKFPIFFIFWLKLRITPIKQNKDKYNETFKLSKEAKSPVAVVPIFAPIIIEEA